MTRDLLSGESREQRQLLHHRGHTGLEPFAQAVDRVTSETIDQRQAQHAVGLTQGHLERDGTPE